MKICASCGELNLKRPSVKEDWFCSTCGVKLDEKVRGYEAVQQGNGLTAKKLLHDEYPWDHENS